MRSKPTALANDLPALIIPNLFPPRPGDTQFDGGLGVRHVEHDLEVWLKRPAGALPGTFIRLFWNSTTQASAFMIVEDKHKDLDYFPIAMPAAQIRPQRGSLVYCTVKRPGSNEQRTTPLNLLIKLTRPGDRDPDPDKEGHQGFTFNLPA
ncbi:hypothetical protein, partial [Pseudomonas sp. MIACH]|uniref:hypothetical protein n=1 Tax=Pseudomonas sp. MIACH TaxID=1078355 RepID=UPI000AAD25D7